MYSPFKNKKLVQMDSIKKKMEKLASETAEAEYRIAHFEELKVKIRKKYLFTKSAQSWKL